MLNQKNQEEQNNQKLKSKAKGMPIKVGDQIFIQSISNDKVIMMGEGIANKKIQCVQAVTNNSNNSIKKSNQFWYKDVLEKLEGKLRNHQGSVKDQETLEFLKYKAKEEDDDNNDIYGSNYDTLVYGADIQLHHIYSNCIMTLNEDKLAKQSGCLLLELNSQNSAYSNFKVKPLNNLYSLGDVVRYGDTISLQNCQNKQFFVHLNQENKQLQKPMEVNASEAMSYFKIKCYSNLQKSECFKDQLAHFDIISLHQSNKILTVTQPDLKSSFVQKHCVTKEDTGLSIEYNQYTIGYFDQEKFFQHENEIYCLDIEDNKKNEIKIKSNPFSFWEIQPEQQFTQDICTRDRFYRLKNLGTNMYLLAENQEVKLTNNYWNPNTLFNIQSSEANGKNQPLYYNSKQLQIYSKTKMILTQIFDPKKNLNTLVFSSKENKKSDLSSMIFQIKRADIQYIQILDKISSINPSLIQFHQFLQNFGMIPYQSSKKKEKSLHITEYEYQQTIKDEKDIQYESQNLMETIDSLKFTVNSAIQNENTLIKIKDLQNITLEQTTLDLLIFILELTNQFMLKPRRISRKY